MMFGTLPGRRNPSGSLALAFVPCNLRPVTCTLYSMDGHRQQVLGLAIVTLLILLFVILRHLWSAA